MQVVSLTYFGQTEISKNHWCNKNLVRRCWQPCSLWTSVCTSLNSCTKINTVSYTWEMPVRYETFLSFNSTLFQLMQEIR